MQRAYTISRGSSERIVALPKDSCCRVQCVDRCCRVQRLQYANCSPAYASLQHNRVLSSAIRRNRSSDCRTSVVCTSIAVALPGPLHWPGDSLVRISCLWPAQVGSMLNHNKAADRPRENGSGVTQPVRILASVCSQFSASTSQLEQQEGTVAAAQSPDGYSSDQQARQPRTATSKEEPADTLLWLPTKHLWTPQVTLQSSTQPVPASLSAQPGAGSSSGSTVHLSRVFMGAAATQGQSKYMEDRHVVAALDPRRGVRQPLCAVSLEQQVSVGCVFDGHAGHATADFAAQRIPHLLHEALSGRLSSSSHGHVAPSAALAAAFQRFDRWWADARCDPSITEHGWDDSGCTAVVGLVSGQHLVVANAGDSTALLASGGRAHRLSIEHRLNNATEVERVIGAGGRAISLRPGGVPRVMGNSSQTRFKGSMVTRSLGDFAFKHPQPLIVAEPHVAERQLCPADRLIVLTSDGATDVLPDEDMLDFALRAIEETQQSTNDGEALAKSAARAVMNAALHRGSQDNITVVAMLLDWGGEYSI